MSDDANVPHECVGTDLRDRIQTLVTAGGCVVLSGWSGKGKTHLAKASLNEALYIDRESARPPLPNLAGYKALILDGVLNVTPFLARMIFNASHAGMGIVVICQPGHEHIVNQTLLDALKAVAQKKPILRLELVTRSGDSYSVLAKLFAPSITRDPDDDDQHNMMEDVYGEHMKKQSIGTTADEQKAHEANGKEGAPGSEDLQLLIDAKDQAINIHLLTIESLGRQKEELKARNAEIAKDTKRLDFMLLKSRKVVIERLPGSGDEVRLEVYVEEGFMGEKRYDSIPFAGDWDGNPRQAAEIRRLAIDLAIQASTS